MIEILTSLGFENVMRYFKAEGELTYRFVPNDDVLWDDSFEVWSVSKDSIEKMSAMTDDEWYDVLGDTWWRYCDGTNLEGGPTHKFTINDKNMIGWVNPTFPDYIVDEEEDEQLVLEGRFYDYPNVLIYCAGELGASTPKNVCAVCTGLAKLNGMTMSKLFSEYLEESVV